MKRIRHHLHRFERWFNRRFGWFFTNGMKQHIPMAIALLSLGACRQESVCGTVVDRYEIMHEHHVIITAEATGMPTDGVLARTDWKNLQPGDHCCISVTRWGNTTAQ